MDMFLYDNNLRHERVKRTLNHLVKWLSVRLRIKLL